MSVYNIAVRMTMTNQVSPILSTIARDLLHIHQHSITAAGGINNIANAVRALGAVWGGAKVVEGMAKMLDHGQKLMNIQNQMRNQGWDEVRLAQAMNAAFKTSGEFQNVGFSTAADMVRKMYYVLGDKDKAIEALPTMAGVYTSLKGKMMAHGHADPDAVFKEALDTVQASELAGRITLPDVKKFMEMSVVAFNASGGLVKPSDLKNYFQMARAAGMNLSDRFVQEVLPSLISFMGGAKTGTAMMSGFSALIGGRMTVRARNAWTDLDLVDKDVAKRMGALTPEGRITRWSPEMLKDSSKYMSDPDLFLRENVIGSMLAKGLITPQMWEAVKHGQTRYGIGHFARDRITKQLAQLFGDRTAQGMADNLILDYYKLEKDAQIVRNSLGIAGSNKTWQMDYGMAKDAVATQWERLMEVLATPNMAESTTALRGLASALSGLAGVAKSHPQIVQVGFWAATAGGITLVLAGVAALATMFLGPFALAAAAIAAATVGLAAFAALNWERFKAGAAALAEGPRGGWVDYIFRGDMLADIGLGIKKVFFGVPKLLEEAVTAMVKDIVAVMQAGFAKVAPWLANVLGLDGKKTGGPQTPGTYKAPEAAPGLSLDGQIQLQRYVPGADRGQMIQTRTTLNIDGRALAEAVAHHMAQMALHASGGSGFDQRMHPLLPDMGIAT